jgi:hypothetical protein
MLTALNYAFNYDAQQDPEIKATIYCHMSGVP